MKPTYLHDCKSCRFLGRGRVQILGQMLGKRDQRFDFYVCEGGRVRSFIARHGNRPEEYLSGGLLECTTLTKLDLVALFNGLELTVEENERLLRVLARERREKFSRKDYETMSTGADDNFGGGNILFGLD